MQVQVKTGAAEVAHRTIADVETEQNAAGGDDTRSALPFMLTFEGLLLKMTPAALSRSLKRLLRYSCRDSHVSEDLRTLPSFPR